MPRPCKRRRICAEPDCRTFGPRDDRVAEAVVMTLDEFETIRLIDLEGLTQEEAAGQMRVARTTVQAIYSGARGKLADCLVNGKELQLRGGDYVLCEGVQPGCPGRGCRYQTPPEHQEETTMKTIAVTYENGQVFQHFGHTEQFKIYDIADGKVAASRVVDTNGSGHGALSGFLAAHQVDTLICGGIGGGAQQALTEAGIRFYAGVSGDADRAVAALLAGQLAYTAGATCDHHDGHGEGHACGSHGCGSH